MRRDHARSLLEQGLAELTSARRHLDYSFQQVAGLPDTLAGAKAAEIFAYCREQKSVFDGICDRAVTHARQILSAR
jgi:hypothetical protein